MHVKRGPRLQWALAGIVDPVSVGVLLGRKAGASKETLQYELNLKLYVYDIGFSAAVQVDPAA